MTLERSGNIREIFLYEKQKTNKKHTTIGSFPHNVQDSTAEEKKM